MDNVIDLESARIRRKLEARRKNKKKYRVIEFDFVEEGVGFVDDDNICLITNPLEAEGIVMSRETATLLGRFLVEAASKPLPSKDSKS